MSAVDTLFALVRIEQEWRDRGWNPDWIDIEPEVRRKCDGLLLIHPNGRCEFLTFWQALRYRLFGALPPLDYRFSTATERGNPHAR
jgi:hypothetical protein